MASVLWLAASLSAGTLDPAAHLAALKPACEVYPEHTLEGLPLITVDHPTSIARGEDRVVITADAVTLNGVLVEQGALAAALADLRAQREDLPGVSPFGSDDVLIWSFSGEATLAVTAGAPVERVRAVLAALHARDYTAVSVLAWSADKDRLPPPPESEKFRAFQASMPTDARARMAHFSSALAASAGCPEVSEAYQSAGAVPTHLRCAALMDALGPALAACPAADAEMIVSLVQAMLVPDRWPTHVRVTPDPAAAPITAAPTDTWAEVGGAVFAAGDGPLWLKIE